MTTRPLSDHHPDCVPIPEGEFEATQREREMFAEMKKGCKRPRELYDDTTASNAKKFAAKEDMFEDLQDNWRPFDSQVISELPSGRKHC